MFKRMILALTFVAALGAVGVTRSADAQVFYGRPYVVAPRAYYYGGMPYRSYYYGPGYGYYGGSYYSPRYAYYPDGYYYRPGVTFYIR